MILLRKFVLLAGLLLCNVSAAENILIGYIESTEPGFFASTIEPVVDAIEKSHPEDKVHVVQM